MNMNPLCFAIYAISIATSVTSCISSESACIIEHYPVLRSIAEGPVFSWKHKHGADFDVFTGRLQDVDAEVCVYLGANPDFSKQAAWNSYRSNLGVYDVVWHMRPSDDSKDLFHTALIKYQRVILKERDVTTETYDYVHVWVQGTNETGLKIAKNNLSRLALFNTKPKDRIVDSSNSVRIPFPSTVESGANK